MEVPVPLSMANVQEHESIQRETGPAACLISREGGNLRRVNARRQQTSVRRGEKRALLLGGNPWPYAKGPDPSLRRLPPSGSQVHLREDHLDGGRWSRPPENRHANQNAKR